MEAGLAQMCQGLSAWQSTGAELARPYFLALLAEAYRHTRQAAEGLTVLTETLSTVNQSGERIWEAGLYRLKGALLLHRECGMRNTALTPEDCFRKAIDLACQQQAKSLELRAATSLARLWQSQNKGQEAYDLLAPVYEWFSEGFDTVDLKDAKALLDELNAELRPSTT